WTPSSPASGWTCGRSPAVLAWPGPPCTGGPATGTSCSTRCSGGGPATCSWSRCRPPRHWRARTGSWRCSAACSARAPEAALRLLTGTRSTVHRGMASALEKLIDLERDRGCFDARLDTPTLAYAIVRISEGFLYADVIADRAPDIDRAVTVIEALLSGLDRRSAPVY